MESIRKILHYLANLEWTEKKQHDCIFCNRERLRDVIHENETVVVVRNQRSAGRAAHWLIIPKPVPAVRHIRDIEALTMDDLPLLKEMNRIKEELLKRNFADRSSKEIHSGYHRGRRGLIGPIILPDIVSVHHLHLHVIVEPRFLMRMFKYPIWLRFMWMSDERAMAEAARRKRSRMKY